MLLNEVLESMETLNNHLDVEDRLEPFIWTTGWGYLWGFKCEQSWGRQSSCLGSTEEMCNIWSPVLLIEKDLNKS